MAENNQSTLPRLLTVAQAAKYLGRSPQTLHGWRSRQTGPPWIAVVGGIRYNEDTLRAWLKEKERDPRNGGQP